MIFFRQQEYVLRGKIKCRTQKIVTFLLWYLFSPSKSPAGTQEGLFVPQNRNPPPNLLYLRELPRDSSRRLSARAPPVEHKGVPCVGRGAVRAVLLDVHAEETHVDAVDLLKRKQGFGAVREGF